MNNKSNFRDPLPTWLVKEYVDEISPAIINKRHTNWSLLRFHYSPQSTNFTMCTYSTHLHCVLRLASKLARTHYSALNKPACDFIEVLMKIIAACDSQIPLLYPVDHVWLWLVNINHVILIVITILCSDWPAVEYL